MSRPKKEPLRALAARLDVHLKRLEAEGATLHPSCEHARGREGLAIKNASAFTRGDRIVVMVSPYPAYYSREQALAYLTALDGGFRGDPTAFSLHEAVHGR